MPDVLLLEQLDVKPAVRAYRRHYPALQHDYEELGFPPCYFNDSRRSTAAATRRASGVPAPVACLLR